MTAPTFTRATDLTKASCSIKWSITNPNNIHSYIITWTNLRNGDIDKIEVQGNTTSYGVTGMNGVDNYNVSVTAKNPCGMMESDSIIVYDKPGAPTKVKIPPEDIKTDSFVVWWDSVTDLFPITYTVQCYGEDVDITATTDDLSHTVTGLTSNTSYNVTVVAVNTCCGAGPVSSVVMATTNAVMNKNGGGNDNVNVGLIIGIIIAATVVLAIIIIIVVVWWKSRRTLHPPANVKTGVVTSASVEVTWDRSAGATGYHISCTTITVCDGDKNETVTGGNTTSHTFTNLVENTSYHITVQGCARYGRKSNPSTEVSIRTTLHPPVNVKIGVVTSTSVEVTWDRSAGATGYHICCNTTVLCNGDKNKTVTGGDTTSYTFTDLVENTPYDITVQGLDTDSIKGDPSTVVPIITALRPPANVEIGVVTSTSVEVIWDQSAGATGYHISCTTAALHGVDKNKTVNGGDTTSYTFTDLVENTSYHITVQGLNADGIKGDPSTVITVNCISIEEIVRSMASKEIVESTTAGDYRGQDYLEIVKERKQEIESTLQLKELADDFNYLDSFLRRAHCGLICHMDLVTKFHRILDSLLTLYYKAVVTINVFKRTSQEALENMQTAYGFLQKYIDGEAICTILFIKESAEKLKKAASEFSDKCLEVSQTLMKLIEATREKEEKLKDRITQVNKNIEKPEDRCKINKVSLAEEETADHLHKAILALKYVQNFMKKTATFWKENEAIFDNISEDYFSKRVSRMKTQNDECQKLFKDPVFTERALKYYGKWEAICRICNTVGEYMYFVKDSVHKYMHEEPDAEMAKHLLKEPADELQRHPALHPRNLALKDAPVHKY